MALLSMSEEVRKCAVHISIGVARVGCDRLIEVSYISHFGCSGIGFSVTAKAPTAINRTSTANVHGRTLSFFRSMK